MLRLGINIDHVATLRNARGERYPDPLRAALTACEAGADGITVHLREDRRHIRDNDVFKIQEAINKPLNLETAVTQEMLDIALKVKPHAICLVPENRAEITTEGGLNVAGQIATLTPYIKTLSDAGMRVSLFIDADEQQIQAAHNVGAPVIEIHTGQYCHKFEAGENFEPELKRITDSAKLAHSLGLECHAGHGLTYDSVKPIAAIPEIRELNIGHFIIGESVFLGLPKAIDNMRRAMNDARRETQAA